MVVKNIMELGSTASLLYFYSNYSISHYYPNSIQLLPPNSTRPSRFRTKYTTRHEKSENNEYDKLLIDEDASSFLSLSEKPDRSIALLDDYEMEELGFLHNNPNHKSGYVAVLGKPNVGKSTLSNQMVGQKFSIVTDKPQTTRHRILGICSGLEYQMILYDTPGVIENKMHKLDSMMMRNAEAAMLHQGGCCQRCLVRHPKRLMRS
ncbi:hypothetical protein Leryth_016610 [Lithospermum erythrorhizon]|nr:hypothetical protein Leryth_016610 [Lithospermum erythrorhizon]